MSLPKKLTLTIAKHDIQLLIITLKELEHLCCNYLMIQKISWLYMEIYAKLKFRWTKYNKTPNLE